MQYISYFSLPPLYLTLACSGEEEGGGIEQNSKIVLFTDQKWHKIHQKMISFSF